jgi:hypothetical protein
METPKLAPPGAGLPKFQTFLLRYFLVPHWSRKNSWSKNVRRFRQENEKVQALLTDFPQWETPILVPPIRGLEDSSRYWSAKDTIEHMMIVGEQVLGAIELLKQGTRPQSLASIAAVKPKGQRTLADEQQRFSDFCQTAPERLTALETDSTLTFAHPWFGPLTPLQWSWLMGVHQGIHLEQLRQIKLGLQQSAQGKM